MRDFWRPLLIICLALLVPIVPFIGFGDAIDERSHAIVEAPTGVGKSFAYLVPLILHALAKQTRVVVSTGTIALPHRQAPCPPPLRNNLVRSRSRVRVFEVPPGA